MQIGLITAIALGLLAALLLNAWLQNRRAAADDRTRRDELQHGRRERTGTSRTHRASGFHRYRHNERDRYRNENEDYDPDDDGTGAIGTLLALDAMDGTLDGRIGGGHQEAGAPGDQPAETRRPETVPIDEAMQRAGIGADADPAIRQPPHLPETVPVDEALERAGLLTGSDHRAESAAPEPAPEPEEHPGDDSGASEEGWGGGGDGGDWGGGGDDGSGDW